MCGGLFVYCCLLIVLGMEPKISKHGKQVLYLWITASALIYVFKLLVLFEFLYSQFTSGNTPCPSLWTERKDIELLLPLSCSEKAEDKIGIRWGLGDKTGTLTLRIPQAAAVWWVTAWVVLDFVTCMFLVLFSQHNFMNSPSPQKKNPHLSITTEPVGRWI